MEIALFGGSFDPPHVGHLLAAAYVLATEPVDELWFVPVFGHPLGKRIHAPFEHRAAWIELAIADVGLARARVSRLGWRRLPPRAPAGAARRPGCGGLPHDRAPVNGYGLVVRAILAVLLVGAAPALAQTEPHGLLESQGTPIEVPDPAPTGLLIAW